MMERRGKQVFLVVSGCLLGFILGHAVLGFGQELRPRPRATYLELSGDFYRAIREESGARTYSNDMTQEYLKEIAISSRFMVETNLQILKNQEQMLFLLESRKK